MHWKKVVKPNSPYFGEQDFDNLDQVITVTIKSYTNENVTNEQGTKLKGIIRFSENVKPLILNVTNGKSIAKLYGNDIDGWIGKKISLFYDKNVKVAGRRVGGTRVKAPEPETTIQLPRCETCGADIRATKSMTAEQVAQYTKGKYGKALCSPCATKLHQEENKNAD